MQAFFSTRDGGAWLWDNVFDFANPVSNFHFRNAFAIRILLIIIIKIINLSRLRSSYKTHICPGLNADLPLAWWCGGLSTTNKPRGGEIHAIQIILPVE
jgi:hypothetical protein